MSFWFLTAVPFDSPLLWLTVFSLLGWLYLTFGNGQFWRADQRLDRESLVSPEERHWPTVVTIVPARNEVDVIERTLTSLLDQDYPGEFHVVMVDDQSQDGTGDIARRLASQHPSGARLTVKTAQDRPNGWMGKMWAVHTGIRFTEKHWPEAAYQYLTDADIEHSRGNLRELVSKAEFDGLDLVSLMVQLHCKSAWERLLIPPFVYFFQKLYPFRLINDSTSTVGGSAGGCMLVRTHALKQMGGIEVIRNEVIDDCALGMAIKRKGTIWVGLTVSELSIRPYAGLADIWEMVTRTAFTQLRYSSVILTGTIFGLILIYFLPPLATLTWPIHENAWAGSFAVVAWALMLYTFQPTLRLYALGPIYGFALPIAALFYLAMTIDSARRYWLRIGGKWKGRMGIGLTDGPQAHIQYPWLPNIPNSVIAPVSQSTNSSEKDSG